jgi:hypothetical protein
MLDAEKGLRVTGRAQGHGPEGAEHEQKNWSVVSGNWMRTTGYWMLDAGAGCEVREASYGVLVRNGIRFKVKGSRKKLQDTGQTA